MKINTSIKKPELIAPAGDLVRLKQAFLFGADAVYASTPNFSMRTREIGFDYQSLKFGINYAHKLGKKVYLTVNTYPHSSEIKDFIKHAQKIIKLKPDALIIADPGVLQYFRENSTIPLHLSTQANTTNYLTANFWQKYGVKRIVLARELSLVDIKSISKKCPKLKLEAFVHGAMCMAYSGRCQISNYFTGRDPNKGECIQACRFKYKLFALEEEMRPGERFPIYEDSNGTYLLNSRDLCMIDHLPELIDAGVSSFKIEGRLKGIYYLSIITRAYRQAIDLFCKSPKQYHKSKKVFLSEILKTSSRGFTTGFYFGKPDKSTNNYRSQRESGEYCFVGQIIKFNRKTKIAEAMAANRLRVGSIVEIVTPQKIYKIKLTKIIHKKKSVKVVHANYLFSFKSINNLPIGSLLRTKAC
ncbi:MAG: U32 family peptidase [Patescibacteria group bacterium]|nr:U32 family peptidase [Patescibacteria group bacterium]